MKKEKEKAKWFLHCWGQQVVLTVSTLFRGRELVAMPQTLTLALFLNPSYSEIWFSYLIYVLYCIKWSSFSVKHWGKLTSESIVCRWKSITLHSLSFFFYGFPSQTSPFLTYISKNPGHPHAPFLFFLANLCTLISKYHSILYFHNAFR